MSDPVRPSQSDFVRELQRLNQILVAAMRSKDPEAIDAAEHDISQFLRLNSLGRAAEWFARQQEQE